MKRELNLPMMILSLICAAIWANHCIVSKAFAAPVASSQRHDCCPDEKGGEHKSQDSGCLESGCCQPGLFSASDNSSGLSADLTFIPVHANISDFFEGFSKLESDEVVINPTTGPPLSLRFLSLDLSLAPNAPPHIS
jgi:hypothetical protein